MNRGANVTPHWIFLSHRHPGIDLGRTVVLFKTEPWVNSQSGKLCKKGWIFDMESVQA